MSRHASRHKLSRKELVQKDEISARLDRAAQFIWDNPKPFLWGVAIVIGVVVVVSGWTVFAGRREAQAQAALGGVIAAYNDTVTFASDEARYQAALAEAERVAEEFGGASAALVARYYAALSHEGLGEVDEAVAIFEELGGSSDPAIRPIAQFALGQSFKKRGEFDRGITLYEGLLDSGEYPADSIVFELGQLHEAAGREGEARTFYESLLAEYPGSVFQADAERAVKRLSTTSAGGA